MSQISEFHMILENFCSCRGDLLAYLNNLEIEFDIIVLSEIWNDASFYLSSFLTGYIYFYELPMTIIMGVLLCSSKNSSRYLNEMT